MSRRFLPEPTERLRFREMSRDDLDQMARMLADPARACVDLVRREFAPTLLTAIIHPDNSASLRVAEHLGMTHIADDYAHPWIVRTVMGMSVAPGRQPAS